MSCDITRLPRRDSTPPERPQHNRKKRHANSRSGRELAPETPNGSNVSKCRSGRAHGVRGLSCWDFARTCRCRENGNWFHGERRGRRACFSGPTGYGEGAAARPLHPGDGSRADPRVPADLASTYPNGHRSERFHVLLRRGNIASRRPRRRPLQPGRPASAALSSHRPGSASPISPSSTRRRLRCSYCQ